MCKSIESTFLHRNVLDILYENRQLVTKKFREVIGFYDIDHIAINIINPLHELVVFSSTPNIEYNLITQNVFLHDITTSLQMHKTKSISWWDTTSKEIKLQQIKSIKNTKNNYMLGMTILRKIDDFCLLYSFATKNTGAHLHNYYTENLQGLYTVGDHCYKSIRNLYASYYTLGEPPKVTNFTSVLSRANTKPYLQLVVNYV